MKDKILKHLDRSILLPEFIAGFFVLLMFTVQLFIFGPNGYRNITIVKYVSFLSISIIFIAVMLGLRIWKNIHSGHRISQRNSTEILVIVYMMLTVISAVVSEFFPDTITGAHRREGALTICIYGLIFLTLVCNSISGRWFIYILGVVTAAFSAVCILQFFKINALWLFPEGLNYYDGGIKYSGEFLGTLGNAGLSATFLCLAIPILLVYIFRAKERARLWLIIPMLMGTAVLFKSKIAAGVLGLLVGIFISIPFIMFTEKRKRRIAIITEAIILIGVLAAIYSIDFERGTLYELHNVLHGNFEDSYGSSRIFIWRNTLPLIPKRPLLGGGPDTLADRIGVIFETVKEDGTVKQAAIDAAHNEYLNIAVCQGIPALIIYLAAVISTLLRQIKSKTKDPVAAALMVGMVSYCVQAFFAISIFISAPYFWIIWALLEQRLRYLNEKRR